MAERVPVEPGRHDLLRHQRDPADDHRRARARPAQGAQGRRAGQGARSGQTSGHGAERGPVMNLGISAEQQELLDAVRRFLADRAPLPRVRELMDTGSGADPAVWQQASDQLGLPGIAIAEEHGGAGFTFAEQAIVLEEAGAALYGGPYLASAVLAATALTASEDKTAMADLLPGLAAGT